MEQDFSFTGIRQLCRLHLEEILDVHDCDMDSVEHRRLMNRLGGLLENRKIRYVDPFGKFGYTKFGHFYFDENDVMMLITKERDLTLYHRPDILSYTLWSTVPVIFAGIDTRCTDDSHQPIFTGDVVTIDDMSSLVRYFHPTIPGLAGDNCELQFRPGLRMHKEGTVFRDISLDQFKHFDEYFFHWPMSFFCPGGMTQDEVKRKAKEAWSKPLFMEPIKPLRTTKSIYDHIDEVLRKGRALAYFTAPMHFDDEEEDVDNGNIVLCDEYPDGFEGETYEIEIDDIDFSMVEMKYGIKSFFLHAHEHPETIFVLGDFVEDLNISNDYLKDKVAKLFHDWFTYNLTNVILPSWIFIDICSWECIGRD